MYNIKKDVRNKFMNICYKKIHKICVYMCIYVLIVDTYVYSI